MSSVRIFNNIVTISDAEKALTDEQLLEMVPESPLIDDVDTSILSFLDAYGQPPHLDIDDADESDLEYVDDDDEEDESVVVIENGVVRVKDGKGKADEPAAPQPQPAAKPQPAPSETETEFEVK
ncbi:hypothetical protein [Dipodfec virus UA06Rod_22]|uniref:Uncharacterized protein n=1 Tax=Dipodfec virus UA06Rod_22 TaxID=2929322 RepID=A0A976N237_9VIRU|nr:hypothetical protein [Dipodfec virus UA06Rod_22]